MLNVFIIPYIIRTIGFNFITSLSTKLTVYLLQIIIIIIVIIIYSLEFFTTALPDGLSQKFEWQQVSSSLQDSSQYSGCSQ